MGDPIVFFDVVDDDGYFIRVQVCAYAYAGYFPMAFYNDVRITILFMADFRMVRRDFCAARCGATMVERRIDVAATSLDCFM